MEDTADMCLTSDDSNFGSFRSSATEHHYGQKTNQLTYQQLRKRRMLNHEIKFPKTKPLSPYRRKCLAQLHQITLERPLTTKELGNFYQDTRMIPRPHSLALRTYGCDKYRRGETQKFNKHRRNSNIPVQYRYKSCKNIDCSSSSDDPSYMTLSEYDTRKLKLKNELCSNENINENSDSCLSDLSPASTISSGSLTEFEIDHIDNHTIERTSKTPTPPCSNTVTNPDNKPDTLASSGSEVSQSMSSNEKCVIKELESLISTQEHLLLDSKRKVSSQSKVNATEEDGAIDKDCFFTEKHEQLIPVSELVNDLNLMNTALDSPWMKPDSRLDGVDHFHVRSKSYITAIDESPHLETEDISGIKQNDIIAGADETVSKSDRFTTDMCYVEKMSRPRSNERKKGHITDIWLKRLGVSNHEFSKEKDHSDKKSKFKSKSKKNNISNTCMNKSENVTQKENLSQIESSKRLISKPYNIFENAFKTKSVSTFNKTRRISASTPALNSNQDDSITFSVNSTIGYILDKSDEMSASVFYDEVDVNDTGKSSTNTIMEQDGSSVLSLLANPSHEVNDNVNFKKENPGKKKKREKNKLFFKTVVVSSDSDSSSSTRGSTRYSKSTNALLDSLLESLSQYTNSSSFVCIVAL